MQGIPRRIQMATVKGFRFMNRARLFLAGFAAVALLALSIGVALLPSASAQDATPPATGTPAGTPVGTPAGTPSATPSAATCDTEAAIAAAPSSYSIVSEESAARYRAQEELVSIGATEAVGETQAIIGTILLGEDGTPLLCSRFDVDLRTLQSDEARRDNYLYNNTLQTETFPLATFVVASIEGLNGPLTDGQTVTMQLVGDMTLHGVTRPATWDAEVTLNGDTLTGTASTTFLMEDYAIEEPVVGPVASVDQEIRLEVDISARRND